jgi:Tol biopolymer transport system component
MGSYGYDPETTLAGQRHSPTGGGRGPWLWVGLGAVVFVLCLCVTAAVASYFFYFKDRGLVAYGTPSATGAGLGEKPQVATQMPGTAEAGPPGEVSPSPEPPGIGEGTEPPPGTEEPTVTPTWGAISLPEATPAGPPTIGAITFASGISDAGEPEGPGSEFSSTTKEIYAFFDYSGMSDGAAFERAWYLDGQETARGSAAWSEGESGKAHLRLYAQADVLEPGKYELQLYLDGKLLQTGTFTVKRPAAAPTKPPAAGPVKVVYAAWDGGKYQLHVMNLDGSDDMWIFGPGDSPSWKPDGTMVSVFAEEGAKFANGLYIVTADGSQMGNKFIGDANIRYTQWSPDGTRIAYDSQRGGGSHQIYVCDLRKGPDACESWGPQGEYPAWNPQSDKIVYRNCDDGKCTLGIINISDGSWDHGSKTRIPNTGEDFFPAWSPNGRQIAFARKMSDSNYDIFVVGVDGSGLTQLTDDPALDVLPAWTPDGRILFRSARGGEWGIYIMNGDGSGQEKIKSAAAGPDWGGAGISAVAAAGG